MPALQNHLYIQLSVELTQRNKVIAKLQCPSFFFFRDLFRIQTSEIVNPHHRRMVIQFYEFRLWMKLLLIIYNLLMSDEYVHICVCVCVHFRGYKTICILRFFLTTPPFEIRRISLMKEVRERDIVP